MRSVEFEVTTAAPLPAGEQVFVTGGDPALGDWQPDALPLSRVDDGLWKGRVALPAGVRVEFKVTRGSWENEEANADGARPPNRVIPPGGDDAVVAVQVVDWADHAAGAPPEITGDYRIHESVSSRYLHRPRKVIVWLPPSYAADPERRYPVLYMHDGQQVFDPRTSTWGQDWQVDEWCTKLMAGGRMREIIVVAAYSTDMRRDEYEPARAGREYAAFMAEELKPMIDRTYRTRPERECTAVAGSSMGAAISMYMAWSRPETYSMAACLSPAFEYEESSCCLDMVRESAERPDLRLYLYCGQGDDLEKKLQPGFRAMKALLLDRGFEPKKNLLVVEDPYAEHNEAAWAKHTDEWLLFLFGKR